MEMLGSGKDMDMKDLESTPWMAVRWRCYRVPGLSGQDSIWPVQGSPSSWLLEMY